MDWIKANRKWVIYGLLIGIALLIVIRFYHKLMVWLGFKEERVNLKIKGKNIGFEDGGGNVASDFNMESYLEDLHGVVTKTYWMGWGISERCEVYERIVNLNDNELRLIAESYELAYNNTIREDIRSTLDSGCFMENNQTKLLERLDVLEL